MAVRRILADGNPKLRIKSQPIKKFNDTLRALVDDMWETMYTANGVGLAAPQIGLNLRVIVIDVPANLDKEGSPSLKVAMVNPELVQQSGTQGGDEGCLSIPGWYGDVTRAERVTMEGYDLDGNRFRIEAEGYCARACQHEVDHLNGSLFLDRMDDALSLHRADPHNRPEIVRARNSARDAAPTIADTPNAVEEATP